MIGSFAILAVIGAALGLFPQAPLPVILILFSLFAFVIAAAADLESVYPAEIFPTEVRASGTGIAASISRIGAAIGTFLLPTSVAQFGDGPDDARRVGHPGAGPSCPYAWAPETRHVTLSEASMAKARAAEQQ